MELSVSDVTTGEGFHIEVTLGTAMDAFHHPYAYATRRESAYQEVPAKTKTAIASDERRPSRRS